MFDTLSQKIQGVFKKLSGQGSLSESNVEEALRSVRLALLEADVHFAIVKEFLDSVKAKALGAEVQQSLNPSQVFVKIVHDELVELMGGAGMRHLNWASLPPTVILLAGLQGTGKTTTAAKLARRLIEDGRKVALVAGDLTRPGAVEQLKVLGKAVGAEVFTAEPGEKPEHLAARARALAAERGFEALIVDTAGRLAIDEALMDEIKRVKAAAKPHEVLLVIDAMQGASALDTAKKFHEALGLDGLILTKLDGDARGGAALSALKVTGKPIKFLGQGERPEALEPFRPERLASRILGMGDVVSLVERVQKNVEEDKAKEMASKMAKGNFDLSDFLEQIGQMKKMGSLKELAGMMPGMPAGGIPDEALDEKRLGRTQAIILSMTAKERRLPQTIHGERRKRIARGSGTKVEDVNALLRQYEQMKKMMKTMKNTRRRGGMPGMGMQGLSGLFGR